MKITEFIKQNYHFSEQWNFNSINCLSNELLQQIFYLLNTSDLKNCQLVSRSWKILTDENLPIVIECEDTKLLITREIANNLKKSSALFCAAFLIAQGKKSRNIGLKTISSDKLTILIDLTEGKKFNDAKTIFKIFEMASIFEVQTYNKNPEIVIPYYIRNLKLDEESFQLVKEFYLIASVENFPKIIRASNQFFSQFFKSRLMNDGPLFLKAAEELRKIENLNDPIELSLNLTNDLCSSKTRVFDHHLEILTSLSPFITSLDLSSCYDLTDEGFNHLTEFTNLRKLDLGPWIERNDQVFLIFKHLTNLSYLNLRGCCRLTDEIGPESLKHLVQLTTLILSHRRFDDKQLESLKDLKELTYLDLSSCLELSDQGLQEIASLNKLEVLNLSQCFEIHDLGIKSLRPLSHLSTLNLYRCSEITDEALENGIKFLASLSVLDLTECTKITDQGLAALSSLSLLSKLTLDSCRSITYKGLKALKNLENLTSLNLKWCGLQDKDLKGLKRYKNLKSLLLEDFKISYGLRYLKNLTTLTTLELSNFPLNTGSNSISNRAIEALPPLHLTTLKLGGNQLLTDEGLRNLAPLTSLTHLDLSLCHGITDQGLKNLYPLSSLTYLSLMICSGITDKGIKKLKQLNQLKSLNLAHCMGITNKGLQKLKLLKLSWLKLDGCANIAEAKISEIKTHTIKILHDHDERTYFTTAGDRAESFAKNKSQELVRRLKKRLPALKKCSVYQKDIRHILTRFEFTESAYCKRLKQILSLHGINSLPQDRQLIMMIKIDENEKISDTEFNKTISTLIRDFFEFQSIPSPRSLSSPPELPPLPALPSLPPLNKASKPRPGRSKKELQTESIRQTLDRKKKEKSQNNERSSKPTPSKSVSEDVKKEKVLSRKKKKET